ncbi:DUF222 domain-containing protein, partial [Planotetraspora mira]
MPCGPEWWAEVAARARSWSSDGTSALKVPECPEPDCPESECPESECPEEVSAGAAAAFDWASRADARHGGPGLGVASAEDDRAEGARPEGVRVDGAGSQESGGERARGSDRSTWASTPDGAPVSGLGVSSWELVAGVEAAVSGLVVGGVPESGAECLAEVEVLVGARDRLISAITARVGRVHGAGEARAQGYASTRMWLRGGCGMDGGSAGRVLVLAAELARLPVVRARFAAGSLSEGRVYAICVAVGGLTDEQAQVAEPILVGLADQAGPAEVARAGRFLRALLDPGRAGKDEDADYERRFLVVRPSGSGGMEGEFRLPREAAARLRTWLDAYAKPKVEGDERPLRVRNADALMALLENKITTELLVLVNAESLPDDHPADAARADRARTSTARPDTAGTNADPGNPVPTDPHPGSGSVHPDAGDPADADVGGGSAQTGGDAKARSNTDDGHAGGREGECGRCGRAPNRATPGLLLATGQLLSSDSIARLARTSSLVRMVMDADGQVLDMGRAVRLATGAQRR